MMASECGVLPPTRGKKTPRALVRCVPLEQILTLLPPPTAEEENKQEKKSESLLFFGGEREGYSVSLLSLSVVFETRSRTRVSLSSREKTHRLITVAKGKRRGKERALIAQ
jgi:hypothetical protein